MNKLIIAKIFLGLLALGLVIAGVTIPDLGVVLLVVFGGSILTVGTAWSAGVVVDEYWN